MIAMRFLSAFLLAALALPALAQDADVAEGSIAPGFMLKTLNPETSTLTWVSLDRFAGSEVEDEGSKGVLLTFFASWCGPCKKEMPYLQQLHTTYKDRGLRVVSVNIDKEEPGIGDAKKLLQQHKITY